MPAIQQDAAAKAAQAALDSLGDRAACIVMSVVWNPAFSPEVDSSTIGMTPMCEPEHKLPVLNAVLGLPARMREWVAAYAQQATTAQRRQQH